MGFNIKSPPPPTICYNAQMIKVKICGLTDARATAAAVEAGADYLGFMFYDRSPRFVTPARAAELTQGLTAGVLKVGVFVDADDAAIGAILQQAPLDMLQLHGGESPQRIAQIRACFALPVIKAVAIGGETDIARAIAFQEAADMLLFDAKPPSTPGALPGGNGLAFDWTLIRRVNWERPWMLSGGLNAGNLEDAARISGARVVDVSSGVESAPGVKDSGKIREFIARAKRLPAASDLRQTDPPGRDALQTHKGH
jgi:phosphoribosylanthranilate isomerase